MECLLKILVYTLYRCVNYNRKGPKLLVQLVKVELLLDSCLNQFLSLEKKRKKSTATAAKIVFSGS